MSNITIIEQREILGKDFKIYGDFENPLFLAKDVAEWIEHNKPSEMLRNVDNNEKIKVFINPSDNIDRVFQPNTEYWFITEDGLYEVLMQSRKPIAKEFKKEVKKILKSIRKHGGYLTPEKIEETLLNPDIIIKLAKTLKEEQKKTTKLTQENEKLNKKIMFQEPKVLFAEAVKESTTSISIGELSKILKQNGLDIGQNRLFDLLRKKGYLFKNKNSHTPTQKSMNLGLFEIKESEIKGKINKTLMVTGKGQVYFINLFINKNRERVIETVDMNYVYDNMDKEYYINYEEIRKYILEKFGDSEFIDEAMESIDIWIDSIPDKKGVSEIMSGREIYDFIITVFYSLEFRYRDINIRETNINVGLIAC